MEQVDGTKSTVRNVDCLLKSTSTKLSKYKCMDNDKKDTTDSVRPGSLRVPVNKESTETRVPSG
jgi:hypothetical protein